MNSKKNCQKRLIKRDTNEKSFHVSKCIIWQRQPDTTVISIKNGRRKIIEAAAVRKDQVLDRLDLAESNFVYHMINACYKSYTLRKTLEFVQKSNVSDNQTNQCGDESGKDVEPSRKRLRCVY